MRGRAWEGGERASRPYASVRALSGGHTGFVGAGEHSLGNPSPGAKRLWGRAAPPSHRQCVTPLRGRTYVLSPPRSAPLLEDSHSQNVVLTTLSGRNTRLPTWKKKKFLLKIFFDQNGLVCTTHLVGTPGVRAKADPRSPYCTRALTGWVRWAARATTHPTGARKPHSTQPN